MHDLPGKASSTDPNAKNIIPLIDFGPFINGTSEDKQMVADHIVQAFKTCGFIYLKNHGIPALAIAHAFARTKLFFARPQHQKDSISWTGAETNRGYITHGREKLSHSNVAEEIDVERNAKPDLKETFEIGPEGARGVWNIWPPLDDEGKRFKQTMLDFSAHCTNLNARLMHAISTGMGLPENTFDQFTDGANNFVRLLHYPPVPKKVFRANPGQVRAGEHSDYGTVTLLFQDSLGGLQIESPDGIYIDVTPIPGTVIVNAADMLARWSNNVIRSTPHRVVEPRRIQNDGSDMCPARYSIACFCNPNVQEFVEALPGILKGGADDKQHAGINSSEYIMGRFRATVPA
ncbi:oxidoreductase [Amanita rubescens]|nr:oxidoreductase [Amanita rubescens]